MSTIKRQIKPFYLGVSLLGFLLILSILAPFITPYAYNQQNLENGRLPPFSGYTAYEPTVTQNCNWANTPMEWGCALFFLGSDSLGRDLWGRVVYAWRATFNTLIGASVLSLVIGIPIGLIGVFLQKSNNRLCEQALLS